MAETILSTEYSGEMQQSYINYSMSVITSRAVPDIRDGLKPVQRRVLYAMNELGLNSDKPHRKSARIVGDTMGKYHPHGDASIYDALVVLAQDFKKGMALVDGHGNFGSIEGDEAAAMRYTESRLKQFTQDVYLADLDKGVVDFVSNFDETEKEPEVLPVRIPNFLVNGSEGIAVGMTTSVPTHNLGEVIDAMKLYLHNPEATTAQLLSVLKGPDFPTGGIVINQSDLEEIYETGKGRIRLRGRAEIEYGRRKIDKDRIVITEIPYSMIGANIGKFLSDVAELAENRTLPDITDILNQSSKEGVRIVLELRKGADAEKILQGLYKKTKLEDTIGVNMLAIVNGKPEVLGLRQILKCSLDFQIALNTRKYNTLLEKELEKKEIQEGLIQAVDLIDLIIEIIRGSKNLAAAKACLTTGKTDSIQLKSEESRRQASALHFSPAQATAILELRLGKLIGLEILALQQSYKKTLSNIRKYESILESRKNMLRVIEDDLNRIRKAYALPRKTEIQDAQEAVFEETPLPEIPAVFLMNRFGYAKLMERGLFDKNEETLRQENRQVVPCTSASRLWVFTDKGLLHQIKSSDIPFGKGKDKGIPLENISNYSSGEETILLIVDAAAASGKTFLFLTRNGWIKRTEAGQFETSKKTLLATKLGEGDSLFSVTLEEPLQEEIYLLTDQNRALHFKRSEVSLLKRLSIGVRAIRLEEGEQISEALCLKEKEKYSVSIGRKKVELSKLKCQKRNAVPQSLDSSKADRIG